MLVIEEIAVLDCGGAGLEPCGAALADGADVAHEHLGVSLPLLAFQAFPQGHGDRSRLRFSGQPGQFVGQPARLLVLDVQAHHPPLNALLNRLNAPFNAALKVSPEDRW